MAAAARPYWTGFLKLSLVTIAVRLYSATTEKERIHFHRIHEPSGERVRYQNVVPRLGPVGSGRSPACAIGMKTTYGFVESFRGAGSACEPATR
jgi:hypothetical protein